jgi:hypothetical protein
MTLHDTYFETVAIKFSDSWLKKCNVQENES